MSKLREYLIRFQMLLFNLYALTYFPLPLPTLSSSIISAGAQWILQSYLKGLSRCCMKTHISQDAHGDSFLQPVPQQQTGRREQRESSPSDPVPMPLSDTSNGDLVPPRALRVLKIREWLQPKHPRATLCHGKAGSQSRILAAAASPSLEQSHAEMK